MNRLLHAVLRFCCVGILLAAYTTVQAQTFTITPDLSNPQRARITFSGSMPGTSPGAQQHRIFLIGAVSGAVSSASVCASTAAIGTRTLLSASISGTSTLILGFSGPLATSATLSGDVIVDLNSPYTWSAGTNTSSWGVLASVAAGTWSSAAPIALPVAGIGVTGNSVSIADGSTVISASDNTDLGQVCVVGGPISQTFTITNPSTTGSLTISNITTANSVLFSVGIPAPFPITVLPSSSTTFTISFDPTAVGVVGTTVSIQNNSCGTTSDYTFGVQGGGINAPTGYSLSTTNSGNFCTGSTTSITQGGSQTGVSYQLYIGGTTPTGSPVIGTGSPLTFSSLNTSGVYTVVATATGGCTATMNSSVTLTERPLPALPTTTAYSVCVGGTRALTGATGTSHLWTVVANSSTGATINGAALTPPTQTFSTQNLTAVGGTSTGQIDLTYKITDGFGCMATTPVTVQVTGASIANITGGTSPICPTATTTLTGVYASAHTPSWSSSNPAIATVVGGVVTGVTAGTVTITFTATEAGGCVGTATQSITVLSGPRPVISGNSAAPLCPGSTRPLSSTTSGLSMSWSSSDPGVADVDAGTGIVTGIAFGTAVITYTVSDASCTGSSTVAVVVGDGTRPTIVCPTPPTGVQNTDPGVCTKTFTTLNPSPTSVTDNCAVGAVALTYQLLNGLTVIGSGSLPNPFTLDVGTTAIRYIATDAGGNVSSCSFSITVADRQVPAIVCPADMTVSTGVSSCPIVVGSISLVSVTDNCAPVSSPVNYSYAGATTGTGVVSGSGTFDRGVTRVTYSVTDASGNTGTCPFVVTVVDDYPATVSCPPDITVNTSVGICTGVLTTPQAAFTASDNCGSVRVTHTATGVTPISTPVLGSVTGIPFNIGSTVVIYTAVDQAGNTASSCTFSVVVADNQPPTIQCPRPTPGTGPITWTRTADINCEALLTALNPVMNDNCGASNLDLEYELIDQATGNLIDDGPGNADGVFYLGNTVVYYTVTDDAGLSSSCSFNVVVLDLTKPMIMCPLNQVVSNTPGLCEAVLGSAVSLTALDNCSGVTVSHISTGATMSSGAGDAQALPFLKGITTVTYVVTDDSNNSTSCRFTVDVQDTELPDIICPAPMTVTAASNCTATLTAGSIDPSPTDNCPNTTLQYSLNGTTWLPVPAPLTYTTGTRSIYYRVTDGAGRQSSCSFTLTVVDNTAPTLTCPTPTPLNTASGVCTQTYTITDPITDNCPGSTWSAAFSNPVNSGVSSIGPINDGSNSGVVTFPLGTTTVTLTATDGTNAASSCTFNVVVSDIQRPTLLCRGPLLTAPVTQCSTIVTPTILDMRPFTLTDNCPAGLTIRANLSGATTSLGDELRPLTDAANNWTFCVGTTNVTYTATDASGNSSTCAFSVVLREPTPPTFAFCPPNLTLATDPGLCTHNNTSNFIAMGADNCDFGFTTSYTITGATTRRGTTGDASGVFNKGVSTITYRVVDASGNTTAPCITVVTINDNQAPVITCPTTPQVYTTRPGFCSALATGTAPTITENCSYTLSYQTSDSRSATNITDVNGLPFRPGLTTVGYVVTDGTNSSSCSFVIEVIDQQPPNITCPNDITVTAAGSACNAVVNGLTATFNDACSGVTLEHAITGATTPLVQPISGGAGGSTFNVGVSIVTYYAVDASSNVSSCMFTVTVRDAQRPTISCPTPAASYTTTPGICTATIPTLVATGTDNCGTAMLSFVRSSTTPGSGGPSSGMIDGGSATFNIGTTVVTYTSTDVGGLTTSCSISVLVRDGQPPALSCPTDNMVASTNTNCTYVAPSLELNATLVNDLCSNIANPLSYTLVGATTTSGRVTGQVGTRPINLGTTQLTYFVADGSGNNSSCIVNITITDDVNPTITCPASTTASTAVNSCTATLFTLAPTATDNCGVASVHRSINSSPEVLGNANGVALNLGTNTITYIARDAGSRSSACTFTVTVNDNTAPSFTCPSPTPVSPGLGCTATIPALVITATDNCAMGAFTYTLNGATTGSGSVSSIGTQLFSAGLTTVTYTATDASSNPRTCTFTVNVTDTQPPTLTCPSSQTVGTDPGVCTASALPVITATATDNCTASPTISYSLNNGAFVTGATVSFPAGPYAPGVRNIRFRAVDNAGRISTCDLAITVRDNEVPALTCPAPANPYPSNANCQYVRAANEFSPSTSSDNCGTPTLTYTLTRGSVTSPVTSGALPAAFSGGTTTVTWLSRDAAGNTNSCSFNVIVSDLVPPTLTCPANTTRSSTPGVCGYTVTATDLRPTVTDNCGTPTLSWAASGVSAGSGSTSASITGTVLSLGTTILQWTGTDVGGNATTCSFTVSVSDTENPSITCKPSASRPGSLISNCTYQTIASEFDPTVSDNCGIASVTYAVGSGPVTPQGTYPTLSSGTNTIVWSATDVNARTSTCAMTITVTNCTFVNGNIVWKAAPAPSMSTLPVNNVIVNLTGAAVAATVTNTSGVYNFAVNGIGTFTITPTKTDNPMNGVDAADISAIIAHASGGVQITDPCNIIAADVQGNQNIDNNDASAINAAILGHAPSRALLRWIFVPRNHVFTPVSVNPSPVFTTIPPAFWTYPTTVTFTSTGGALPSYNFWGVHRGDVNNSTNLGSSSSSAAAEGQAMTLMVPDRMLNAGEIIRVPVSVRNFHDLAAYQFAFGFDVNQLEYVSVQTDGSALGLNAATNFGDSNADGGELRTLWAAGKGRALTDDARLFFVQFRVLQSGKRLSQVLRLDGTNLPAKAFDSGLLPQGVVLRFTDSGAPIAVAPASQGGIELMQNRPNPFTDQTTISFVLPQACEARLRIYDLSGRLMMETNKTYTAGYQEETIQLTARQAMGGVYYYELTTPFGKAAKKMILADR
jgi:HYR domain